MRGGSRQERRWSNCIGCWFVVVDGDVVVVVVVVVDDDVFVDVVSSNPKDLRILKS